jgi:hypothetical protein
MARGLAGLAPCCHSNAAAEAEKGEKSGEEPGDGLGTRLREWRSQRRSGERREEGPAVVQEPDVSSLRAIRQAQELGMSAADVRALTVGESADMLLPLPTNTCHTVLDAGGKEDNAHLPIGDAIAILLVGMTRPMTFRRLPRHPAGTRMYTSLDIHVTHTHTATHTQQHTQRHKVSLSHTCKYVCMCMYVCMCAVARALSTRARLCALVASAVGPRRFRSGRARISKPCTATSLAQRTSGTSSFPT